MEVPEWIQIGTTKHLYKDMNTYQRPIYVEICRMMNEMGKQQEPQKTKTQGVMEYLAQRLDVFGGLKKIKNFYEPHKLTGKAK